MREYTENYIRAGGTESFSAYYTAEGEVARFDPELAQAGRLRPAQPRLRRALQRVQPDRLPQRHDLLRRRCSRTGCTSCSTTASTRSASSRWDTRSRSSSRSTRTRYEALDAPEKLYRKMSCVDRSTLVAVGASWGGLHAARDRALTSCRDGFRHADRHRPAPRRRLGKRRTLIACCPYGPVHECPRRTTRIRSSRGASTSRRPTTTCWSSRPASRSRRRRPCSTAGRRSTCCSTRRPTPTETG